MREPSKAAILTTWTKTFRERSYRFVICSGGGPGIMEAANRGAADAKGKTIGLNIGLPFEQLPNPDFITRELGEFEFHFFHAQAFWFAYLSKAMVVFPGGFGTMDELSSKSSRSSRQKSLPRRSPSFFTARVFGRKS